jgi:hypothetical protein
MSYAISNLSRSELLTFRAATFIASAISNSAEGGSILIDGLDYEEREPVVAAPQSGIAVSFDKTTEFLLAEPPCTVFAIKAIAEWMFRTRYLVTASALSAAINRGAGNEVKYKVENDVAGNYLDAGLCVGWWMNPQGNIVLDWSVVLPHSAIAHAAAAAIGAKQDAVYVIDTGTTVKVEETTVKGVGFDIIAKGGAKITAKVKN